MSKNRTCDRPCVVIGAEHPTIGYLYLNCIRDSEVGYEDIYEVTDKLLFCEVRLAGWREQDHPTHDGSMWDEWCISHHLSRIYGSNIYKLCRQHGLETSKLLDWCKKMGDWIDIPVVAELNDAMTRYEARALAEA
ncbi:hypothetical protein [Pectobacterium brasiliense]|uniref:hypothetical protein n=1 Tax=Pectobacterium brasiliense TaxID=180957 RepID=UPI001968DE9F|nr:hypothetical protein [Pectobacterium brasiliense]MBN3262987.1 hypothetical protein [Pectobacterium brasiliense]